jgi:hypothetical protein
MMARADDDCDDTRNYCQRCGEADCVCGLDPDS